jgi:hypothetical protein
LSVVHYPFLASANHSQVAMDDGSIVVVGGIEHSNVLMSPDRGKTWNIVSRLPICTKYGIGLCVVNRKLVLFGSTTEKGRPLFQRWVSSDRGSTWVPSCTVGINRIRVSFGYCSDPKGRIYLIGGQRVDSHFDSREVWRSNDGGVFWLLVHKSESWTGREFPAVVCTPRGHIVMMGGADRVALGAPLTHLRDTWVSTNGGVDWSLACRQAPWPARFGHRSVCTVDGSILLMGGVGLFCTQYNDVWSSRDEGRTWVCVTPSAPWPARHCFGASAVGACAA